MKRLLLLVWALCMLWASAFAAPELVDTLNDKSASYTFPEDAELLEVVFPQISDCDACMIRQGEAVVLIDTATAELASRVIWMLDKLAVDHIDAILITHPHHDHMGGLELIVQRFPVGIVLYTFPEYENTHMETIMRVVSEHHLASQKLRDGDRLMIGKATMDVWCKAEDKWSVNDRSAVTRLVYGQRSMLFTADIEANGIAALLAKVPAAQLRSDILKYPHHGKAWLGTPFHQAVGEKLAIMTVNDRATTGKKDMRVRRIPVHLTTPGFLTLTTDGETWLVERTHMGDAEPPEPKMK